MKCALVGFFMRKEHVDDGNGKLTLVPYAIIDVQEQEDKLRDKTLTEYLVY